MSWPKVRRSYSNPLEKLSGNGTTEEPMIRKLLLRLSRFFRRPRSSTRIFAYFDGQRWRSIDPIQVVQSLEVHPKYIPEKHLDAANNGDLSALEIIADAVCDVFGVKAYDDGEGLTVAERKGLLDAFYLYCHAVKKNTQPG